MPIEILCKGCSRKLRVGDEHAGKHARCPECGEINPIVAPTDARPTTAATDAPFSAPAPSFGASTMPSSAAGPAASFSSATANPQPAAPSGAANGWTPPPKSSVGPANPFGERPQSAYGAPNPYEAPRAYTTAAGGWPEAHRGALILVFGILGFFVCPIFAILAWVMGAEDLRKMNRGSMDPTGRGLTQAGMIIGIVQCVLLGLSVAFFLFIILLGAMA